jgi:hypothetical protein
LNFGIGLAKFRALGSVPKKGGRYQNQFRRIPPYFSIVNDQRGRSPILLALPAVQAVARYILRRLLKLVPFVAVTFLRPRRTANLVTAANM